METFFIASLIGGWCSGHLKISKLVDKETYMAEIFSNRHVMTKEDIERKIDDIMQSLSESGLSADEIHELKQYFNDALQREPAYHNYLTNHRSSGRKGKRTEEIDIVFDRVRGKRNGLSGGLKKFPNPIRIIISLLFITLGFAMIILPAPPYFEMYTIFYFNENDGFTLMDLISLLIVFCGVFTLIMTMQKRNSE
jgi:hypothetical protein